MNKPDDAQHEPSMEDILTSIRRILSEESDEADQPSATETVSSQSVAGGGGARDKAVARSEGQTATDEVSADGAGDVDLDFDESGFEIEENDGGRAAATAAVSDGSVLDLTPEMRVAEPPGMVSSAAASASTDVLAHLAKAVLDHRDLNIASSGVTLEGMVRQMLKPLLKEWLDRNLPYLIERLVKREIDLMINRAERLED